MELCSCIVPTCYRRDRGAKRQSQGCCRAWCYDRGSGLSAAPPLAAAEFAIAVEVASQTVASMLQRKIKADILTYGLLIVRGEYVLSVQG